MNIAKLKKRKSDSSVLTKRTRSEKIVFTVAFIIFLIHCITLIFPVLWMFASSLKTKDEFLNGYAFALPAVPQFNNYVLAFSKLEISTTSGAMVNFWQMILNSIWYVGISTFFYVIAPAMTGYAMSKYRFKGREFLYTAVITSMMIPLVGTTAANMKFMNMIGLYDTPLLAVYNGFGEGFGASFLVFYGFFKSVSWSYAEAVQVDGGGPFTIFFKIMLPQATPIMLTYAITHGIAMWNEYESVLLYLPSYPTLAAGLIGYKKLLDRTGMFPVYYAGLFISMIPTLIIFAAFSNKIMGSISIGGLKG